MQVQLQSRMKIKNKLLAAIFFSVSTLAFSDENRSIWFSPQLDLDDHALCESIEEYTVGVWREGGNEAYPKDIFKNEPMIDGQVVIDGKEVYITEYRHPGCGGACERYQMLASTTPFPDPREDRDFFKPLFDVSPSGGTLLSLGEQYFIFKRSNEENALYQLNSDASWNKLCSVRKLPNDEQIERISEDYSKLKETLSDLREQVKQLRQSAGSCGSMATHYRWTRKIDDGFEKLIYAPSKYKGKVGEPWDLYETVYSHLQTWSLLGIGEYESLQLYQKSLDKAVGELAWFYQKHFGYAELKAVSAADFSLKAAISSGIRFYDGYMPFSGEQELELRRAILEKRSVAEIKSIDVSQLNIERLNRDYRSGSDSILNVAVRHPDVIGYLVGLGLSVNQKNIFGKTPLMYAAQNNGFEAAQKLIEKGADVTVGTIIPMDTCGYTLKTSNMSPLHYAVRYAEKPLIELLLDSGASIYSDVENRYEYPSRIEYPVDWLSRFENPLLSEKDKVDVKVRLVLPPKEERVGLSNKINIEGERLYGDKDYASASNTFLKATQVDSNNVRALNNYALTLLKLGEKERSIEVSSKVISSKSASDRAVASAYFNAGLACDKSGKGRVYYNGKIYCRKGSINEFVRAFERYPTKARANSIINKLTSPESNFELSCVINEEGVTVVHKLDLRGLMVLHESQSFNPGDLSLVSVKRQPLRLEKRPLNMKLIKALDLQNGYYLSIYRSQDSIYDKVGFAGQLCASGSSELVNEAAYLDKFRQTK